MKAFAGAMVGVVVAVMLSKYPGWIRGMDIADAKRRIALVAILGPCGPDEQYPDLFREEYRYGIRESIAYYLNGDMPGEWWEIPRGHAQFREAVQRIGEEFENNCQKYGRK